jgi:ABC-2 type transport system ATP-binding protein
MEQIKERYWSRYAQMYDEYAEYVVGKTLRRAIVKRLSEERDLGEVMECGCGTGYFTKAIAENAGHVIAIDLSDEMLEASKKQLGGFKNITLQKADCENMPFPSERFDTLLMANILHIIKSPVKALREGYRILKNGGLLLVVSYTDYGMGWLEKVELGIRYFKTFGFPPSRGLRNYSPYELSDLVEGSGFKVEEVRLIGNKANALFLKGLRLFRPSPA